MIFDNLTFVALALFVLISAFLIGTKKTAPATRKTIPAPDVRKNIPTSRLNQALYPLPDDSDGLAVSVG